MDNIRNIAGNDILLKGFNNREQAFFSEVYSLLYSDLCGYANRVFERTEIEGCDVIHDIFISIWSKNDLVFSEVVNIKAYVYTSIKNRYKNHIAKNIHSKRYQEVILSDEDAYVTTIVENEITSLIATVSKVLPEDCAAIFKLYLEGWDIKDIAKELNMPRSSVYAKKINTMGILKRKFKLFSIVI